MIVRYRQNNILPSYKRTVLLVTLLFLLEAACYEKTLRKIVRDHSKMVHRPFSEDTRHWRNGTQSISFSRKSLAIPGYTQVKTLLHRALPKTSILPSKQKGRNKFTLSKMTLSKDSIDVDTHIIRKNMANVTDTEQYGPESVLFYNKDHDINNTIGDIIAVESFYEIPVSSTSSIVEVDAQTSRIIEPELKIKNDETITIPDNNMSNENNSLHVKSLYIGNTNQVFENVQPNKRNLDSDVDNEKVDYLIEAALPDERSLYTYNSNISVSPRMCAIITENKADIDAQAKFLELDIEPRWITKKHYWNHIFDSRYESLMRNANWPNLQVILMPRTHVDTIYKRTFDQYHRETVNRILSNIVKKLQFYTNLTFTWNEVSHLSVWWKYTSRKNRLIFRRLVKSGRLEITTGGWVETDEATSHLFGIVHQLTEGHQWLKSHLNCFPKVAWLTNSVAHSPTLPYLLSISGISNLIMTNIHYSWEQLLAEYQYSDFVWIQNWDHSKSHTTLNDALYKIGTERLPTHSVLTHYMQFNSAGFRACGPDSEICVKDFNFLKSNKRLDLHSYNIKDKSEKILEQYSKTGTISPHNVVIAPIGGLHRYESQTEFDYQYNNYKKILDFVDQNSDIYKATIEFGTPSNYFDAILEKHKTYPVVKGDFLNFADINTGIPAYWTGYFTSRPLFKILLRRLLHSLRTAEILFSFAVSLNKIQDRNLSDILKLLIKSRETTARLQDRNVVSGTLTSNAMKYAHTEILKTLKSCWYIQEVSASLLSIKPHKNCTYLQKYVYRDGEVTTGFKTVAAGDLIYVFNSMNHKRTEIVEVITRNPNIRIIDHNKKEVTIQVNPVWKYNSDNVIRISRQFYKIVFAVSVPPMALQLYQVRETFDSMQSVSVIYCTACIVDDTESSNFKFPFYIQAVEPGDIQLESYKYRLIFDEYTGFLKTVVEKDTGIEKYVLLDYGAFRSSEINSGIFLFNTNVTKPLFDILLAYKIGAKSKIIFIVSGTVTSEFNSVFGHLLHHTVKIFNLVYGPLSKVISVESKVDFDMSPKNREVEIFLSLQTDIENFRTPKIYIDNNGFQYTPHAINISRRIESNIYPITSMVYLQDRRSRLTLLTDHAQGVTALQEGQLVVMLDRRVLYNDGRGTNEGLSDNTVTLHRHFILLENFMSPLNLHQDTEATLELPSLTALHLADVLNYPLDIYFIDKQEAHLCNYAFLPLIKISFPCDVSVINFRIIRNVEQKKYDPASALLTLHRQSFACNIDHAVHLDCIEDNSYNVEKILRDVKAVFLTNLVGTDEGVPITMLNLINFPPMSLLTLRIYF